MKTRAAHQLFENATRIFEVAGAGDFTDAQDFALLIRHDGGMHFIMESSFSVEAAAVYAGAQSAFRITRSLDGVRVEGRSGSADCVVEQRNRRRSESSKMLLRDQPLYCITSPLLTAGSGS